MDSRQCSMAFGLKRGKLRFQGCLIGKATVQPLTAQDATFNGGPIEPGTVVGGAKARQLFENTGGLLRRKGSVPRRRLGRVQVVPNDANRLCIRL